MEQELYRSPCEAYPFLSDPADDLRCDFELLTDELASLTGALAARLADQARQSAPPAPVGQPTAQPGRSDTPAAQMDPAARPDRPAARPDASAAPSDQTDAPAALSAELLWVCELVYHLNPTLRTFLSVTQQEYDRLRAAVDRLQAALPSVGGFVLPVGCPAACDAHLLRVRAKQLVRLLYRHARQGHDLPPLLLDVTNLLSGYFFLLALTLNAAAGVPEIPFVSRNYPPHT